MAQRSRHPGEVLEHPKQTKDNDGANVGQATVGAMPIDTAPRSEEPDEICEDCREKARGARATNTDAPREESINSIYYTILHLKN